MSRQSRFTLAAALAGAALVTADDARAQHVLFAPGTDDAYKQEVLDAIAERQARLRGTERYSVGTRWEQGSVLGTPISVTWSIVPDGTGPIPKLPENFFEPPAANSAMFATLDSRFGTRNAWLAIVRDAFQVTLPGDAIQGTANRWGNISGLNFFQVTAPPVPDPDDPEVMITFDWDTGAMWDATGSTNGLLTPEGGGGVAPADPLAPGVGDIRIAMKTIDNAGGVLGYAFPPDDPDFPGEIVLDVAEEWNRTDVNFRYMRNIVQQMIGFAIGLELACPEIRDRLMEPFAAFGFTGPQTDDIRGVQYLYGDYLEVNDAVDLIEGVDIGVSIEDSLLGQFIVYDNLSIDIPADLDVFVMNFPDLGTEEYDFDVLITAIPIGETYLDGPATDGACTGDFETINASAQRDLRIAVMDSLLVGLDGFDCNVMGPALPTDGSGYFNQSGVGDPECVVVNITQPGTYFVIVGGSPSNGGDPDESQLYSLTFAVGNQIFNEGISFDTIALAFAPAGIGANRLTNVQPSVPGTLPGETAYRGRTSRVGNVEGTHPSLGHSTTEFRNDPPPLISQDFPPQRIAWTGSFFAPPAVGTVSGHATAAIACAIGNPSGVFPDGFVGVAPEASWLSASIGIRVFGDGSAFTTSREALAYGLFGLTNPETALSLGLPDTATVLNSSWGSGGDYRGDSTVSQMYDAVVYMTGVPSVVAAGDTGSIDNTPQCSGFAGNAPGSLFRGSRTVTFPGTAFNTIAVGAAGKELPEDTPPTIEFVVPFSQPYTHVIDTSAKGPIDSFNFETATTTFNSRPGIDVVSIGSGYILEGENPLDQVPNPGDPCNYRGHPTVILVSLPALGSNEADPDNPVNPERFQAGFGTSFAAPAVAGALALLQDYAANQSPPFEIDSTVLRAILLTGARKLEGWSNGPGTAGYPAKPQDNRDGRDPLDNDDVVTRQSTQALDYAQGAGFADLVRMFEILRGRYDKPSLAGLVFGAPSTDIPITIPEVPIINTPPNEQVLIVPIPIGRASQQEQQQSSPSLEDLPPTPLEIADMLRRSREGIPENPIFRAMGDFGDPDIGQVGGSKSASGINFDARVPFKLPPNPNRPGSPSADPPLEIPEVLRIIANPIGWDHAQLGQRLLNMPALGTFQGGAIRAGYIDYYIAYAFDGIGDSITASLCWDRAVEMDVPDFSDPDNPLVGEIERMELENLDLELIQTDAVGNIIDDHILLGTAGVDDGGVVWAFSRSAFSNVEHIHTRTDVRAPEDDDEIMPAGFYTLRVRWVGNQGFTGQIYDLFDNSPPGNVEYGLAWRVEPTESSDPDPDRSASRRATAPSSQPMRVFTMFLDAFGTREGDEDYSRAFDVNRDGAVDVQDFGPIYRFWFTR